MPDGTFYGEGKGIITTKVGIEYATATGRGEGRMTRSGSARYPGMIFFITHSGNNSPS